VKFLFVATDRPFDTRFDFFDVDFKHLPFTQGHPNATKTINKPVGFERMIQMACQYAYDMLKAKKLTLGVFENNLPAYYCYKAAGFKEIPMEEEIIFEILGEKWKCIEMEMNI
ncbi:MAG: hypothetical protein IKV76_03200, partial [Clostridia bacterium]|nr:hypothetical protein [Clostridia bacterium]